MCTMYQLTVTGDSREDIVASLDRIKSQLEDGHFWGQCGGAIDSKAEWSIIEEE